MYVSLEKGIKAHEKIPLRGVTTENNSLWLFYYAAFDSLSHMWSSSRAFVPANLLLYLLGAYLCNPVLKTEVCQQMRLIASLVHSWLLSAAVLPVGNFFSTAEALFLS